ncbi:MAG TPA: ester cyclase [Chryseolinea sp.]|nr:ester cyclase [Chryseolinea sp.]
MKTQKEIAPDIAKEGNNVAERNKDLMRRAVKEIWNDGNYDDLEEFVTPDFTIHFADPDEQIRGIDGVKQFYTALRRAFPDIHFTIDSQIAESDKVVTRWTARGTHKGVFRGIPPTGRKFTFSSIDIDRVVDGKVVECWPSMDELGLLRQLGVVTGVGDDEKTL